MSPKKNNIQNQITENNKKNMYKITFKFLSGYPLIQYNLPKVLFQNLSIEKIITFFHLSELVLIRILQFFN